MLSKVLQAAREPQRKPLLGLFTREQNSTPNEIQTGSLTRVSLSPKVFLRANLHILWIHFYANFGCVVSRCWAPGATATPMRLSSLSVCPAVDAARLVPESQRTRSSVWRTGTIEADVNYNMFIYSPSRLMQRLLDFSGMCSQHCVVIEWFLFE